MMEKKSVSKKKKEKEIKEEKLEEEIKNSEKEITLEELTESIPENNIRESLINKEIKAPVLEKIANQEEILNFRIDTFPISTGKSAEKEDDSFKYIAGIEDKEEPKYQNYEQENFADLHHAEIESFGRGDLFPRKEIRLKTSPEATSERDFEKYTPVERFEKEKLGREDFMERKQIKYKASH